MMRGALLAICLSFIASTSFAQEVSEKEKALFMKVEDLASYGYKYENPAAFEKYTKTFFTEKSVEFDYVFRCTDPSKQPLVIQQSIAVEPTEKDADNTYQLDEQSIKEILGKDLHYTSHADIYPNGKRWEYKLLYTSDVPTGFVYHYQRGRYTVTLLIVGPYFDNHEAFKEFMEPLVRRADDALKALGLI